jgi:hypothetical protein
MKAKSLKGSNSKNIKAMKLTLSTAAARACLTALS